MFGHDNPTNNDDDNNVQGDNHSAITASDESLGTPTISGHEEHAITPAAPAVSLASGAATDDLLDIKHAALQALTPLVGQLEQTPEEQFRTTMMMIQASDDHALIKVAYDAAQKIGNEKERAQALLDIVNEINYFTQQS